MEFIVILGVVILAIPLVAYAVLEARWRSRWPEVAVHHSAESVAGDGAYRRGTLRASWTEALHGSAPGVVRLAAFSCFLVGMSAIVSAPPWVCGVIYAFDPSPPLWDVLLVVAFVPGVVAAALVSAAGVALLRGDLGGADRATARAQGFVIALNATLFAVSAGALALLDSQHHTEGLWLPVFYTPLSVAQAVFTRAMFLRNARHFRGAGSEPERMQAEAMPPGV